MFIIMESYTSCAKEIVKLNASSLIIKGLREGLPQVHEL